MTATWDRAALRQALAQRYPWVAAADNGPRSVEAGECDACGAEARLVTTCGPAAHAYLGRRCAARFGAAAWCDGHGDVAAAAVAWVGGLPPEADVVARLWWVATGEVQVDPAWVDEQRRRLALRP